MKRSEILETIRQILSEEIPVDLYCEEMAEKVLSACESVGMQPPCCDGNHTQSGKICDRMHDNCLRHWEDQ